MSVQDTTTNALTTAGTPKGGRSRTALSAVLDTDEVQGLVARGYGRLPNAAFSLYTVTHAPSAQALLGGWADEVDTVGRRNAVAALDVALTAPGLLALGLPPAQLAGFAPAFVEGMVSPHRSRILGDTGENDPSTWAWGGPRSDAIHVVVLVYAASAEGLAERLAELDARTTGALRLIVRHDTDVLADREPFGFADGISQPRIADPTAAEPTDIPPGEFVLGYRNAYDQYTWRPLLPPSADPDGILPLDVEGSGARDLGRNGTYLVFRQLAQDVDGFWEFVRNRTASPGSDSGDDTGTAEHLAARMVGRWRSGAPLVLAPDHDDPTQRGRDFVYAPDLAGLACPRGAHIRRVNPRDSLEPVGSSRADVDRHRLLRRARSYTAPRPDNEGPSRGLHFLCLNANIARQYEFVQHTWINDPTFDGLRDDADPLLGPARERGRTFTVQARPVRHRHRNLPAFVRVRGGAYFFLPSRSALRYLATVN